MSVADFKKFGQMIGENETVRSKAKEIGMTNINGQIAYAKTLGLEFTASDISELVKETGVSSDELDEEQLEQIAGGAVTTTFAIVGAVAGAVGAAAGVASIGVAVGSDASRNW